MNLKLNAPHPANVDWNEYQRKQLNEFEEAMRGFEGNFVEHPYLDTVGKITVCRGKNIDNPQNFYAQPWQLDGQNRQATFEEQVAAYAALKGLPYGQKVGAKSFKGATNLRLPKSYCADVYQADMQKFYDQLQNGVPNFSRMPLPTQFSLLAPHYQTGSINIPSQWPNLHKGAAEMKQEEICGNIGVNPYDKKGNLIANIPQRNAWGLRKCWEEKF